MSSLAVEAVVKAFEFSKLTVVELALLLDGAKRVKANKAIQADTWLVIAWSKKLVKFLVYRVRGS